jgi:rhamnose transport system permease protein
MKLQLGRVWPSFITLVIIFVVLAITKPEFFSFNNLRDLALTNVPVLLVATGITLVIIVAQIDISVGSIFAVTSVLCGLLAKGGVPMFLLPMAAVVVASGMGAINGALVSFVRAPSIVVTLATMVVWRELLRWITGGAWVEGLPRNFQWFGLGQDLGQIVIVGVAALVFMILWWASEHLSALRAVYATGSNPEAARLAGISTTQVTLWVFVLLGALTGLAAVLSSVRFSDVPANAGIGLELTAIAAVVVGGTPITGGRGSLPGTLIGVLLLGSIGPALTFLGGNSFFEKAIQGGLILITVLLDALINRRVRRTAAA